MLRKLDMKMTLFAVILAACGLFLMLGVAKPWSGGEAADGFAAVDDEMRLLLKASAEEKNPAQAAKESGGAAAGPESTADKGSAAAESKTQGSAEAAALSSQPKESAGGTANEPKPQSGGPVPSAGGQSTESGAPAAADGGPVPAAGAPSGGNGPVSQSRAESTEGPGALLHLNQATAEQLDALPGIGPSRAAAIIELRKKRGGAFRSLDELLEIKGIGEKSLQKLKPLLTL
ncbi:helix-hairpin-helix domain-containing protein [Paenibacillus sp. S-38]|uniref:ComEA family DNA-binding protein n=1 Tax=Paenibacillus sp. S-38 TaxID=3416710 RepID=UPI003CF63A4B